MEILEFTDRAALRRWLEAHHDTHPGAWVRLTTARGRSASDPRFEDLLEEGLCFGWSESTRRAESPDAFLQRFTPGRRSVPHSPVDEELVRRLDESGLMTIAGYAALRRSAQRMAGGLTEAVG